MRHEKGGFMFWQNYSNGQAGLGGIDLLQADRSLLWLPFKPSCEIKVLIFYQREAHTHLPGCRAPPPGHLPHPGIGPTPLTSPASAGRFFTTSTIWKAL